MTKFLILFFFFLPFPANGSDLFAFAGCSGSKFHQCIETIAPGFTAKYDVEIQPVFGSSGKLYAQIKNGAPYDLFFSADFNRPQLLHEAGICASPFVYASGEVVLWSWDTEIMGDSWQEVLLITKGKVAIANPETAPYGAKGFEAIQKAGLVDTVRSRFVYGQSVGQTFVFAQTANTELGFVALSQALSKQGRKGKYWRIPETAPVEQWGCVITKSKNHEAAQNLLSFFSTDSSREILKNHGYNQ